MARIHSSRTTITVLIMIATMTISTLLYAYLLWKDVVRPGGFSSEWNWGRRNLGVNSIIDLKVALQALLLSLIFILLSVLALKENLRARFFILPMIVFFSFYIFLGISIEAIYAFNRVPVIIANNGLTGHFEDAIKLKNPFTVFINFEHIRDSLIGHSRSHPPGGILFFWLILYAVKSFSLLGQAAMIISRGLAINSDYLMSIDILLRDVTNYKASIIAGFLLPLLGFISVFPLYQIGKILFNQRIGIIAGLLSLVIPSYFLISPQLDQTYPLLAISFLAFYVTGLKRKNIFLTIVSGMILLIAYFFSIALALLLPLAFLLSVFILSQDIGEGSIIQKITLSIKVAWQNKHIWIVVGTIVSLILVLALVKINIYAITMSLLKLNAGFNENVNGIGRTYSFWVVNNLYDYFFFLGIPISILFFWSFFLNNDSEARRGRLYAGMVLAFILLLDFSGINRAEIARLWMFFMPLFILGAAVVAYKLTQHSNTLLIMMLATVIALQTIQTASFAIFLRPYEGPGLPFFEKLVAHSDYKILHFLIP